MAPPATVGLGESWEQSARVIQAYFDRAFSDIDALKELLKEHRSDNMKTDERITKCIEDLTARVQSLQENKSWQDGSAKRGEAVKGFTIAVIGFILTATIVIVEHFWK